MTKHNSTVGADLLVIPDGASANVLRIGIQVTPTLNVAGGIALERWPAEIANLAESIRIRFGTIAGGQVTEVGAIIARSALGGFFDPANEWNGKSRRDAASAMWQEIFEPVGFEALIDAINEMGSEQDPATVKIVTSRTAELQLVLDTLITFHETRDTSGYAIVPECLKQLARRVAAWMNAGPSQHASSLKARVGLDPMRERADQLEALKQGFELLLREDAAGGDNAFRFAAEFEAEIGTMFREHWVCLFGEDDPPPPAEEPSTDDWGETPIEAASRKLSALLALPTLSHYLGLGVQVEIPREALGGLSAGAISAEFVDADGNRIGGETAWTAFEIASDHFGPSADPTKSSSVGAFSRGLLNLGAQIDGRTPRFALRSDDVVNTLHNWIQAEKNGDEPNLKRYRRGLVLYDLANKVRLSEDEAHATGGATKINYLNDLLAGIRPDFALAIRGAGNIKIAKERWRPTTFRTIVCKHAELDPAFYNEQSIIQIASRDHGYATALVEEKKNGTLSREDEMFAWAGESLAVHAKRTDETGPVLDPYRDLALNLTYALPVPGSSLGMPPLREGVGYACGCRLVYVNGGGPEFASAASIYEASPELVIGDAFGKPYVFPAAPLPPPDIHLGWEDHLIRADDLESEAAGETSDTLVIRKSTGSARRFVTPPRGGFDSAEQQRQFDDPALKDDSPHGALSGPSGIWLFGSDGKFPEARFGRQYGGIRYLDGEYLIHVPLDGRKRDAIKIGSKQYQNIPYRQSRGTVAILGRRRDPSPPNAPFHPDSNGGRLKLSLHRVFLEGVITDPLSTDRYFWQTPERAADAVPIVLDLLPGTDPASFGTVRNISIRDVDGRTIVLPYVSILLPEGETYRLRLKGDGRRGDEGAVLLTLVHAVDKPLRVPGFRPKEAPDEICSTNGVGLRAVTVTVRKDNDSDEPNLIRLDALKTWAEKVRQYEATGLDMRCWPSEEGGATTFFTGRVDLDRKSTGMLRCEAIWEEFNESSVSRTSDGRWIENIASETAQLFKFDVERRGGEARVDLLRAAPPLNLVSAAAARHAMVTGVPGELRTLSHAFRDGRARRLKVKMVATSAFTSFYPDDLGTSDSREWIGRYDLESSRFDEAPSIWTDCTFRPPPPKIDRVLPLFDWDKVPGQQESSRRTAHLRVYLDEGWYASGADERLGIVVLGDDDPKTVCDYQAGPLGAFHRFISQAGSDPVRSTSPVPLRIEPRHFKNAPAPVRGLLHLAQGDGPSSGDGRSAQAVSSLPVTVLPFAPRFTEDDGLFCDIQLDLGDSYFPFLRLGMVRYQEHAVDHLRLSHAVAFDVQLLPERRLWVEVRGSRRQRTVVLEGPGFEVPHLGQASHQRNTLRLAILAWDEDRRQWREILEIDQRLEPELHPVSRGYRWKKDFDLPSAPYSEKFMLLAEEYERLPIDKPNGQYVDGEAVFEEVGSERLVFTCLLPLKYWR